MRRRILAATVLVGGAAVLARRARPSTVRPDEGLIVGIPAVYDALATWLLASFHDGVADDIETVAGAGARVLDVGCGPGHLAERLASRGLTVTGIDVDPGMIERARARLGGRVALHAADVASLPFDDGAFDVVVSTVSMHHWTEPDRGLAEIARVLRDDGRAIVWDLAAGVLPFHTRFAGPAHHVRRSPLGEVRDTAWRWPGPVAAVRRVEARALKAAVEAPKPAGTSMPAEAPMPASAPEPVPPPPAEAPSAAVPATPAAAPTPAAPSAPRPIRVLFVCTGNSARSQLSEALLGTLGGARFEAASAGTAPVGVNPYTLRVLAARGIDWSAAESKTIDRFLGQRWDYVVTVCDRARQTCPVVPGDHRRLHWDLDDPAAVEGTDEERLAAFERTAEAVTVRVRALVADATPAG